jgi:hypothetical protein
MLSAVEKLKNQGISSRFLGKSAHKTVKKRSIGGIRAKF